MTILDTQIDVARAGFGCGRCATSDAARDFALFANWKVVALAF